MAKKDKKKKVGFTLICNKTTYITPILQKINIIYNFRMRTANRQVTI